MDTVCSYVETQQMKLKFTFTVILFILQNKIVLVGSSYRFILDSVALPYMLFLQSQTTKLTSATTADQCYTKQLLYQFAADIINNEFRCVNEETPEIFITVLRQLGNCINTPVSTDFSLKPNVSYLNHLNFQQGLCLLDRLSCLWSGLFQSVFSFCRCKLCLLRYRTSGLI